MADLKRLLIVKTSSMGDVIHMLPALTDMRRAYPELCIDWLVEEGFADIPAWHPAVNEVIPVALRRWRGRLMDKTTWQEISNLKRRLSQANYDRVLDSQGLLKSAVLAGWAKRPVMGLDAKSAREFLAAFFYHDKLQVAKGLHAIDRNRQLAAQALNYSLDEMPLSYGLDSVAHSTDPLASLDISLPDSYVVFLHAASKQEKEWSIANWITLGQAMNQQGLSVLLPWANEREHTNAKTIAVSLSQALVLPKLGLDALADIIVHARLLIGGDSGLSHMAAAFNRPIVALYLSTDPDLTGVCGATSKGCSRVENLRVDGGEQDVSTVLAVLENNTFLFSSDM